MPPVLAAIAAIEATTAVTAGSLAASAAIAVGAGAGSALAVAVTTTAIVSAALPTIVTFGALAGLSAILAPGPPKPQAIAFSRTGPTPERQSGFGRAKITGDYMLYDTATEGGTFQGVLAMHDGLIDGYEVFYLNDDRVSLGLGVGFAGNGWVTTFDRPDGRYSTADKIEIQTRRGLATETAYATIGGVAPPNWDATHRGDGIASIALGCRTPKLAQYDTVYPNGLPNPSAVSRLQWVYDPRNPDQDPANQATWSWSRNPILGLMAYLTTAAGGMNLDYASRILPAIDTWIAAANDCDVSTPVKNVSSQIAVNIDDDTTPVSTVTLFDVSGLKDGASITIGSGLGTEEVMTVASILGLDVHLTANLANDHRVDEICSWVSDPDDPAMEPRYAAGGVYKHSTAPGEVVKKIIECFDGWLSPRGDGAIVVKSGRYEAPTVTLTSDNIVDLQFQHFVEDEAATNVFLVKFSSPVHAYSVVETDQWRDDDDIDARGIERTSSLELDWVQANGQARRLAKRACSRALAPIRGTLTTNLYGMLALGERYLGLQVPEIADLADVVIEVTGKPFIDLTAGTLSFPFIVADPSIDDWNPFIEEGNAPAGIELNTLPPLEAPVITSATPDFSTVASGAGGVRLAVAVAALGRDDLSFSVRWKVHADGYWSETPYQDVDDFSGVTLQTSFVPVAQMIDVQVAYATGDGRFSPWSTSTTVSTATDTSVPDTLTGLTVASWGSALNVIASAVPRATSYRWRFFKADGATLIATYTSSGPSFFYINAQAALDGVQRAYVIKACGVNAAGAGAEQTISPSMPAPAALAGVSATGGATQGQVLFTPNGAASYAVFYSNTSGFSPASYGSVVMTGSSPAYINGLPAGTYYARVAAVDSWSSNPALLNLSSEISFVITTGGGASPSGGGGGGSGGGYAGNARPAVP